MKLSEIREMRCACVYCITLPDGKCYVGKTKNMRSRITIYERNLREMKPNESSKILNAINGCGLDACDFSVLAKIDTTDQIDLDLCLSILEIKYIREKDSVYPNGYNVSIGGEILGISSDSIVTNNKMILQYDENGHFMKEYNSIAECAYSFGVEDKVISSYAGKRRAYMGKYVLMVKKYNYIPQTISVADITFKERVKYNVTYIDKTVEREKIVVVDKFRTVAYDMNGDFCGEYDSNREAARTFTSLDYMPYGKYVKGHIIFRVDKDMEYPLRIESFDILSKKVMGKYYKPAEELNDKIIVEKNENNRHDKLNIDFKVDRYDTYGAYLDSFDNIRDASYETGIAYSCIWANVFGKTKKTHGYIFRKS